MVYATNLQPIETSNGVKYKATLSCNSLAELANLTIENAKDLTNNDLLDGSMAIDGKLNVYSKDNGSWGAR